MNQSFEKTTVLITGGAAGIGKAAAIAFAARGANVSICDLKVERGEALAHEIEKTGGRAAFFSCDVSKTGDVEKLVAATVKQFGSLNYAFNNAGIEGVMASTDECTEENFDRVIAVNLKGTWLSMRYEIREMLRHGKGAIVNNSSVAGLIGFANASAYVASKHAVVGLTKTAALEYANRGIRVNAICPGVIHTEMIDRVTGGNPQVERQFAELAPIARMGTPKEIADAAVWLCSEASSFVTGHALAVDGGFVAR